MATLEQRLRDLATAVGARIKTVEQTLAGLGGGGFATIKKTADEARTASASLTVDGALKVTLGVGQWRVRFLAALLTANATMDFKYDFNFTGTATWKWNRRRDTVAGIAAGTDAETVTIGNAAIGSTAKAATSTGVATVQLDGVLNVTVAGEFQFRWAQNTSDPAALTVLEGSTLEYLAV